MQVLRNAIVLVDIPTQLEFAITGSVIRVGVSAEELARIAHRGRLPHNGADSYQLSATNPCQWHLPRAMKGGSFPYCNTLGVDDDI